ncbi:MAG: DNA modification methylase [Puniceicoccaceae bacterium 5H]|nr:MAG: DNA modification methylase [Puniceicoccaceae bacterium 5H]
MEKTRAPRNRTLTLSDADRERLPGQLLGVDALRQGLKPGVVQADFQQIASILPEASFDLLILDPPYNLPKNFNGLKYGKQGVTDYTAWLEHIILPLKPLLKAHATVYICGDWLTSHSIYEVASRHFQVRNRITWEREKGRGAARNWKNCTEDIWFCTCGPDYYFDLESVKLRRRVVAPYRDAAGQPKDWNHSANGKFRDTHPSNVWTDITIPFWSMPENTDHPTQKSEKLLAKLILASCPDGGWILDPFLGSGTTAVVGRKLGRNVLGIEQDPEYCLLAQKRLERAPRQPSIQGYAAQVFWERNSTPQKT